MLRSLFPAEYVESVYSIDYRKLYNRGYRAIIFDIDNTLVPHGDSSNPKIDELFERVQRIGFKTLVLSNNDEERIISFLRRIDAPYVCDARKPLPDGFERAVEILGIDKSKVVFIGDQVFTDVLGANRCGLDTILVKYIGYYDKGRKGKRRMAERLILRCYDLRKAHIPKLGDVLAREDF